jgi:hypothetical protein
MKRKVKKILLVVLVIFLISILAGCEPHFLDGMDDEGLVEQIVYDYWLAIMNRQYELAKWNCIPGGVWDHKTDELEECINANSEGEASVIVYFTYPYFNKKTEVIGDTAFAYTGVPIDKIPFPGSSEIIGIGLAEIDNDYEMELIRETLFEGWKLK